MSYHYEMNYKVIIEAPGLDSANIFAREIRRDIQGLAHVSEVLIDATYPKHRNDLDHAFREEP
jgi:hypothetical protein